MPISFDKIIAGDVFYDVSREQAGNTMLRRTVVRPIYIKETDTVNSRVLASWNGNTPKWHTARNGKLPWRRSKPVPIDR